MKKRQIIVGLGLLVNKDGKILITLRNDPDHPEAHNKWELPGGGVEFGETIQQAVVREMKEEVGVDISILDYPPILKSNVWKHPDIHVHALLFGFLCRSADAPYPANEEIADVRFITPDEVDGLSYLPKCDEFVKEGIAAYLQRSTKPRQELY